jgi:hypothetical protein
MASETPAGGKNSADTLTTGAFSWQPLSLTQSPSDVRYGSLADRRSAMSALSPEAEMLIVSIMSAKCPEADMDIESDVR